MDPRLNSLNFTSLDLVKTVSLNNAKSGTALEPR